MRTEYLLKFWTEIRYICLDLDPIIMNFGVLHAGWVYVSCLEIFVLKMLDVIYLQLSQIYVVVEDAQW